MKKKFVKAAALARSLTLSAGSVLSVNAAETQPVTVEQQTLGLSSIDNARQLGGYVTKDGRHVKDNLLLRTAKLSTASEEDLQTLKDTYNLGYVVDFRTSSEIASAPDPQISGVENIQIRILDESQDASAATNASVAGIYNIDTSNPAASMLPIIRSGYISDQMYVDMALSETGMKGYREFFQVLLNNEDGKAVLWHCTGGKDRAGLAAVLVLSALGVDRETILNDFALTNNFVQQNVEYMGRMAMQLTSNPDEINGVMYLTGVNRDYMETLLNTIDEQYGSIEGYLVNAIGLTPDDFTKLQTMYLE